MAKLTEILDAAKLTKLQRAEYIAEERELVEERAKAFPISHPRDRGVKKAARILGIAPAAVRNAEQIARITTEAKQAAVDAGIDDNQQKLLLVAREPPDRQVAMVQELRDFCRSGSADPVRSQPLLRSTLRRLIKAVRR